MNGFDVGGDHFPAKTIAARCRHRQQAVFINQADCQTVKLWLHRIFNRLALQTFAYAAIKGLHFCFFKGIVQGKHGNAMRVLRKACRGLRADTLRR